MKLLKSYPLQIDSGNLVESSVFLVLLILEVVL